MGETFIDLRGILERYKVPPDPDVRVVLDPRTWKSLNLDADELGMRVSDLVRAIVEGVYYQDESE
ncbi:MAG: hypothetical protein QGG26_17005 [Candidatus Undinarchaeales archaeon]|jgi:hypothetical protein|nr:hypothetical protein [Candidatus Undinarchaeales archaeon]